MKKVFSSMLVFALSTVCVFAQPEPGAAPSRDQVVHFLTLMQAKQRMVQMIDGMKAAQKKGAEEGFKHLLPDATPDQIARVDSIADQVFVDMPIDEMFDAMIPIYQRHLTSSDLQAAIAFYQSPAGQKILQEQPAMLAEGMQAGQEIMLKRLPAILDRLTAKVTEFAKAEQMKAGQAKQEEKPVQN